MDDHHHPTSSSPEETFDHILEHLSHLLPAQGPIGVFIHHNTLHAFQNLPFEQAVVEASKIFKTEPYMREDAYRAALWSGRIRLRDLDAVLNLEGRDVLLRKAMLTPGIRDFRAETIHWELENEGFRGLDRRAMFEFWLERLPQATEVAPEPARPRDAILARLGEDTDDAVHSLLIKLAAAYTDQGMAYWPMPQKELGFWRASLLVLGQSGAVESSQLKDLSRWAKQWSGLSAREAILAGFEVLGLEQMQWEEFLKAELLALPGWAGLMRQLELEPSLAPHEVLPASLVDFLAVRMLLTTSSVSSLLRNPKDWRLHRAAPREESEAKRLQRAAVLQDAAYLAGHTLFELRSWNESEIAKFMTAVEAFDEWERRRVWHLAYERRHERQILLPLRSHAVMPPLACPPRLEAQVFFCIDEREESIRRHLEEADPEVETFGAAGFFGVAMNYEGMDDAHGVSLCPVVVKPAHAVLEKPFAGQEELHNRRQSLRRLWARAARESFVSSRTLLRGWLGTTLLGIFSIVPMAARVLNPRRYAQLMDWLNASVLPEPRTELTFMRADARGHDAAHGLLPGFSLAEKVDRVAGMLGAAGLRKGMARIVAVLGHGSTSLNNPHESAHDCGACGGRRGGPNARIFAAMANHPEVRRGLRERDILIPEDTWFVGGYHDTANDDVDLYDLEDLPATHRLDVERLRTSLDEARARSALERARRFEAASNSRRPIDGLHHVLERSEHLAEPRPEYGHCTNSVCIVGRRSTTRGLFLDRRAFLVSYDATQDPENASLAQLLGAVIPVCGGISLEYYFSFVDNERYGCGTKLPHNVTGLVGVMNGFESDLRTGLPWQMVEIHEPVRILFVVESTPERVLATIRKSALLWEFLSNRWIRLATMDPRDGSRIHMYRGDGEWELIEGEDEKLFHAKSSIDWYHGRREHLPMARIDESAEVAVR